MSGNSISRKPSPALRITPVIATIVAFLLHTTPPVLGASLLPLQTESARTLPRGQAELVLGASYFRNLRFPHFTGAGALRSQHLVKGPEFAFRVGAGDWAEIQAEFEMISLDEVTSDGDTRNNLGPGDARLYTKIRAWRERGLRPAFGVRFGTKLPNANASNRLGTDETDFGIDALFSKRLGNFTVHTNLGLVLLGNPGPTLGAPNRNAQGQDDLVSYAVGVVSPSISALVGQSSETRFVAEFTGLAGSRFGNNRSTFLAGLQIQLGALTFFLGGSTGLITASENFGINGGLIYGVPLARFVSSDDSSDD